MVKIPAGRNGIEKLSIFNKTDLSNNLNFTVLKTIGIDNSETNPEAMIFALKPPQPHLLRTQQNKYLISLW